jgi:hypothetical protein
VRELRVEEGRTALSATAASRRLPLAAASAVVWCSWSVVAVSSLSATRNAACAASRELWLDTSFCAVCCSSNANRSLSAVALTCGVVAGMNQPQSCQC